MCISFVCTVHMYVTVSTKWRLQGAVESGFPALGLWQFYIANKQKSAYVNAQVQGDTKKRELLKTPTKIEEIQEKKNY